MNIAFRFERANAIGRIFEIGFDTATPCWILQESNGHHPRAMTAEKAAEIMAKLRSEGAKILTSTLFEESAGELRDMEPKFVAWEKEQYVLAQAALPERERDSYFAEEIKHMSPSARQALRDTGMDI